MGSCLGIPGPPLLARRTAAAAAASRGGPTLRSEPTGEGLRNRGKLLSCTFPVNPEFFFKRCGKACRSYG